MKDQNSHISQLLGKLDFQFKNSNASSIYFVSDLANGNDLHPKIILDLDKASIFKADAVYFRFFEGDRLPQPQIYIYDNSDRKTSKNDFAEIHRDIWSASEIPVFIILEKSWIQIYDSRKPVEIKDEKLISKPIYEIDFEKISEYSDVVSQFNAQKFDSGSFWESDIAHSHFLNNKTAYEKLISGLRSLRNHFKLRSGLSPELSDHLLILSILVKYLEENGLDEDGFSLASKFFFEKTGYHSFEEIIRNGKIIILFSELAEHFNGGLFKLTNTQKEELLGETVNVSVLANFLEGKIGEKDRFVIWAEYSFKYIPVELISNFYEEFLPKEKKAGKDKETNKDTGAVYTPGFLVNFLVDECLPLNRNELNENVRLSDVSCGSGIFLATAFKRLVQRWRIRNAKNGKLADTTPEVLKNILLRNIYGVDIDRNAVELTIFSLNLSLCTMLTPRQIWTQLEFDDLKEKGNIVQKDFFEYLVENKPSGFDLIIGNPPFVRRRFENGKSIKEYTEILNKIYPVKFENSKNEMALLFLEKAMHLLKDNGLLCLILPSGPLLYFDNSYKFRKGFFKHYNILQVFDLTYFRRILFKATVPTLALFVEKKEPDEKPILHITAQRTKTSREKQYFEVDHYDFYDIPKKVASVNNWVWKSDLIGGGRVFHLIERLSSIKSSISQHIKVNEIEYKGKFLRNDLDLIQSRILIRKSISKGKFPQYISENDFLKNSKIEACGFIGESDKIKDLVEYLNRNKDLLCFFITATSGRQGLRGPYTIIDNDISQLPVKKDLSKIELSFTEKIIVEDVVNYKVELFGQGENAKVNFDISDPRILEDFSDVYCKALNSIYQENGTKYGLSKIYEGNAFFACEYTFTNNETNVEIINSEADFNVLIDNWSNRNVLIKRVVRLYGKDKIIMIKPKQLRYWLKSIALRDVDETLEESFYQNSLR